MIKIYSDDEILNLLKYNNIVILYFTGSACGACEAICPFKAIVRE